jgi:hypothetical protein
VALKKEPWGRWSSTVQEAFTSAAPPTGVIPDYFIHRAFLQEFTVLIAVYAVFFVLASIGIGAEDFFCERHTAALAIFLFHIINYYILALLSAPAPVPRYLLWAVLKL